MRSVGCKVVKHPLKVVPIRHQESNFMFAGSSSGSSGSSDRGCSRNSLLFHRS